MGPAVLARPPSDPSPPRPSRFKSFSAFLNPFSSASTSTTTNNTSNPSAPASAFAGSTTASPSRSSSTFPHPRQSLTPSAPLPYHATKTDISLTDLGHIALSGSPFRVYIKDNNATDGLPSAGLGRTPDQSNPRRHSAMAPPGLPLSHYPLADLSRGANAGRMSMDERTTWKEMPTLASAIHIAESGDTGGKKVKRDEAGIIASASAGSSITTSKIVAKVSGAGGEEQEIGTGGGSALPRSTSSASSIFEAYRNRKTLRRSASRASTKGEGGVAPSSTAEAGLGGAADAGAATTRPRRMSRRLSFDSIRHSFAGSRRRDKENNRVELDMPVNLNDNKQDQIASSKMAHNEAGHAGPTGTGQGTIGRQHRLALPPMRSLRNKFSVGNAKNAAGPAGSAQGSAIVMAAVKADVAARRRNVHAWDDANKRDKTRGAVGDGEGTSMSLGSAAGRGALRRMEQVQAGAHPLQDQVAGSGNVTIGVTTLPSEAELHLPKMDQRRASMLAHPSFSPRPISPGVGAATTIQRRMTTFGTIDTPGPLRVVNPSIVQTESHSHQDGPNPSDLSDPTQTIPTSRSVSLGLAPSTSQASFLFSPARDDRSILDPARSPFPVGFSSDDISGLGGLAGLPMPPPRYELPQPPLAEAYGGPLTGKVTLNNSGTLSSTPGKPKDTKEKAETKLHRQSGTTAASSEGQVDQALTTTDSEESIVNDGNGTQEPLGRTAKRQQSLSEMRDALRRMRDLSGMEGESEMGSVPSSRRASEMPPLVFGSTVSASSASSASAASSSTSTASAGSLVTAAEADRAREPAGGDVECLQELGSPDHLERDATVRRKVITRPSIDLSNLDDALKAVVSESMRTVELGTPRKVKPTAQAIFDQGESTKPTPEQDAGVSQSSSASSGMVTAHTSLELDISPARASSGVITRTGTETGPAPETETLAEAQSGRSWHTAQEHDPLTASTSNATCTTHSTSLGMTASTSRGTLLPRSKSRSTHDIASLASGRNLVDHMEETVGEGWWSVERKVRPKLGRRASNVEGLRRYGHEHGEMGVEVGDGRLRLLERLAKGATPRRWESIDAGRRGDDADGVNSPRRRVSESGNARAATPERRSASVLERREWPRSTIIDRSRREAPRETGCGSTPRSLRGVDNWRPASVQPRMRGTYARPSLISGSTWSHDTRTERGGERDTHRSITLLNAAASDDTPTKAPKSKTLNKISPEIARRASCLTRGNDEKREELDSPLRVRVRSASTLDHKNGDIPSDEPRVGAQDNGRVAEVVRQMEGLKAKHLLELDAILSALGGSKAEVLGLREEIGGLKRDLKESLVQRDVLKERVRDLEQRLRGLIGEGDGVEGNVTGIGTRRNGVEGFNTRGRSSSVGSVISTLLPELAVPDTSLVMHASPLELAPFSPENEIELEADESAPAFDDSTEDVDVDEFGRKSAGSTLGLDRIVHGRSRAARVAGRGSRVGAGAGGVGRGKGSVFDMSLEASFAGSEVSASGREGRGMQGREDRDGEWTLKLRSGDEAHLNDL